MLNRQRGTAIAVKKLNKTNIGSGLDFLSSRDPDLAQLFQQNGTPPLWSRKPGFATLVQIILEQQVSLASARAVFARLNEALPALTPETFLALGEELQPLGFSRQKTRYCRALAESVLTGVLDLKVLVRLDDEAVREELTQVKGIGRWTAEIYLMMALNRPDVWPIGDLAIVKAVQHIKGMTVAPSTEELERIGECWRPWRAVAARLLWQHYLNGIAD